MHKNQAGPQVLKSKPKSFYWGVSSITISQRFGDPSNGYNSKKKYSLGQFECLWVAAKTGEDEKHRVKTR
jgi:hypothetical protein